MRRTVLLVTVLVLGACGRGSGAESLLRSLPSATATSGDRTGGVRHDLDAADHDHRRTGATLFQGRILDPLA